MKGSLLGLSALCLTATSLVAPRDAHACGGCFVGPSESTVVTGHRMALSISPTQAVLWDQIQYSGDPAEFSWVLPVKPGARIELSTDAFFEALDAGTTVTVQSPPEGCGSSGGPGLGCSSGLTSDAAFEGARSPGANEGVEVIHEGTVGPYETVTLSSENPYALEEWLEEHGYTVPDAVAPTVRDYVDEGFDFIALRLQPGQGVQQMKPVRVVTPGTGYTLPLRMVAAGAGSSVELVLFVIGEGRYETSNFANAQLPLSLVTWDFLTDRSDYAELRLAKLGGDGGRTWLTTYAQPGSILGQVDDPIGFSGLLTYTVGGSGGGLFADTLAEAYFLQAGANQEGISMDQASDCAALAESYVSSLDVVVDPCDATGENCRSLGDNELGASTFACGPVDDLATALVGLHPSDVYLTRLEAKLPVEALDIDLQLGAALKQEPVQHRFSVSLAINACHDQPSAVPWLWRGDRQGPPVMPFFVLAFVGAALTLVVRRWRAVSSVIRRANATA
jgi:hypothetical protein